jgi:dihydropteroate synthase
MKSAFESNFFSNNKTINLHGRLFDVTHPQVMGILNMTPDSFFDGGTNSSEKTTLLNVEKMIKDGASMIDVGGYSSRPGASIVTVEEEISRTIPIIKRIRSEFKDVVISIDTFRSEVARRAVEEGAHIINDISAGDLDAQMLTTVAMLQVPYIAMHMRGTPETMSELTHYDNVTKEVTEYLQRKINLLHAQGVKDIIIDPGFGFAKSRSQNFTLLNGLEYLHVLEKPILVGVSRKSMIWKTLATQPESALNGTTSLNTVAILKGASILRVHDVKEATEVITLMKALKA